MKKRIRIYTLILSLLLAVSFCGCTSEEIQTAASVAGQMAEVLLEESSQAEVTAPPKTEIVETESPQLQEETSTEELPNESDSSIEQSVLHLEDESAKEVLLDASGTYDQKEDVALYIHQYGHLPDNYITKKEAEALGWNGGSLEPYAPGKCIGGSRFGNYEKILPEKDGRKYTECDIDTLGKSKRGAKRIVFSNDGLIYYTEDHYETFELLFEEDAQ